MSYKFNKKINLSILTKEDVVYDEITSSKKENINIYILHLQKCKGLLLLIKYQRK